MSRKSFFQCWDLIFLNEESVLAKEFAGAYGQFRVALYLFAVLSILLQHASNFLYSLY